MGLLRMSINILIMLIVYKFYIKLIAMGKKVHLSVDDIKEKIAKLELEKVSEDCKTNKTKRKRIYAQLAKLQKALGAPE